MGRILLHKSNLIAEQCGILGLVVEPEQGRRLFRQLAVVHEIELQTERTNHLHGKGAGLHKTGHLLQTVVCAESGLKTIDHQNVEKRSVSPITCPFGIAPVRSIVAHRKTDPVGGAIQNFLGPFGCFVRNGNGAEGKPSVADLIPVVFGIEEPVISCIVRGNKSFIDDCFPDRFTRGFGQIGVEPVVPDAECHGHLPYIETVAGVPIRE